MSKSALARLDPSTFDWDLLTPEELTRTIELLKWNERHESQRLFFSLYPDEDTVWLGGQNRDFDAGATIFARRKYPKHLEFFRVGANYPDRGFMAANRVSKTLGGGGYELTCHLTGLYPHWWEGRRFTHPVAAWAAGDTNETTRDIIQACLVGTVDALNNRKILTGTGVIPGHLIGRFKWKSGVEDLIDQVWVKHVSGAWSHLALKSYEQGRKAFQGTAKHIIWLDEEPPADVADECRMRLMTTRGLMMLTFTPLEGLTNVALSYLPEKMRPGGRANRISQVDRDLQGRQMLNMEGT